MRPFSYHLPVFWGTLSTFEPVQSWGHADDVPLWGAGANAPANKHPNGVNRTMSPLDFALARRC